MAVDTLQTPLPEVYEAQLSAAHDYAWAERWPEAARAYEQAVELCDSDGIAFLSLGLALYNCGEPRQALDAYRQAHGLGAGEIIALQRMAAIHAELGERIQAASTYLLLADAFLRARQPAGAVRAWQQVIRYDALSRTAFRRLATAYQRGGRADLAAQALTGLARIHANAGEAREAMAVASEALELVPGFIPARQLLGLPDEEPVDPAEGADPQRDRRLPLDATGGHTPLAQLDSSEEESFLDELSDTTAGEAGHAAMERARQYMERGQTRAAIDELYWALSLAPYFLPLHRLLADLFLADGRPDDAVAKLVAVSESYVTRLKPTQAIDALRGALAIAPADQNVLVKLIDRLTSHGEIDEALEHYVQLAERFYQLAQGERALEKLNEALRLAPRSREDGMWVVRIQTRLADIYIQRLDWRRAAAALQGIQTLNPGDLLVVRQLADLLFKMDARERALDVIRDTAHHLAEAQRVEEIEPFLQAQMALRPEEAELLNLLGEWQVAAGDGEGAPATWERADD